MSVASVAIVACSLTVSLLSDSESSTLLCVARAYHIRQCVEIDIALDLLPLNANAHGEYT